MPVCKKVLRFLGCSCTAPNSAIPKLITLLQRGLVDLITGYCIFGLKWRQLQLCCCKVGKKVPTDRYFGHKHGSNVG